MQRIDTEDGLFHPGDPLTNTKGTIVTAEFMNALQEEQANIVEAAGLTLDPEDDTQKVQSLIIRINTIAALRALSSPFPGQIVKVLGYYASGDGGGGSERIFVSGAAPGTYVDNGGSVIVPTGGDGSAAWIMGTTSDLNLREWGAYLDATNDDAAFWRSALENFPATGGRLFFSGCSVIGSTIIWPNNGTTECYPITIQGIQPAPLMGTFNTITGGPSEIKYTGEGKFFDCRNGDDSALNWSGSFRNCRLSGVYTFADGSPPTETNENSVGLYLHQSKMSQLRNVSIIAFGRGVHLNGSVGGNAYWYYSGWDEVSIYGCKWGVYGEIAAANGTKLNRIKLSQNKVAGAYFEYPGDLISFDGCWVEQNAVYAESYSPIPVHGGIVVKYPQVVNIDVSYFEGNGEQNLNIIGTPYYGAVVNMHGCHHTWSKSRYSMQLTDVRVLNATGNYLGSYVPGGDNIGRCINIVGLTPRMNVQGNTVAQLKTDLDPTTTEIHPAARTLLTNAEFRNEFNAGLLVDRYTSGAEYLQIVPAGTVFFNDQIAKAGAGGEFAWCSTVPGGGVYASLNGVEPADLQPDAGENHLRGSISQNSRQMTVVAYDSADVAYTDASQHRSGLYIGASLQIDTDGAVRNAAFTPATFSDGTNYAQIVRVVSDGSSNCVIDLNKTLSSATVSGGLLRYKALERKFAYAWTWYKSVTSVSTSGTGIDTLMTADTFTAGMLKAGSLIKIFTGGVVTGANNTKEVKLYFAGNPYALLALNFSGLWKFEGEIRILTSTSMVLSGIFLAATTAYPVHVVVTGNIANALSLYFTGECLNASDTITQNILAVELR